MTAFLWVGSIFVLFGLVIAAALQFARAPRELAGCDLNAAGEGELSFAVPVSGRIRLWVTCEVDSDDEDLELNSRYELLQGSGVLHARTAAEKKGRIWLGGKLNWEKFTDHVDTFSALPKGAELKLTIAVFVAKEGVSILRGRVFVSR